jgi:hypothetical protein
MLSYASVGSNSPLNVANEMTSQAYATTPPKYQYTNNNSSNPGSTRRRKREVIQDVGKK